MRGTKNDNAERTVDLLAPLTAELTALRARRRPDRTELVFPTAAGRKQSDSNVRMRLLAPARTAANARLEAEGADPILGQFTPHSRRRTFASLMVALGKDMTVTMEQLGHEDATLTLNVYSKPMAHSEGDRERCVRSWTARRPSRPPLRRCAWSRRGQQMRIVAR